MRTFLRVIAMAVSVFTIMSLFGCKTEKVSGGEATVVPTSVLTDTPTDVSGDVSAPTDVIINDNVDDSSDELSDDKYVNTAEYRESTLNATDALGRTLTKASQTTPKREGKYVGIFYFLWAGEHGRALYDNSVISTFPPPAFIQAFSETTAPGTFEITELS